MDINDLRKGMKVKIVDEKVSGSWNSDGEMDKFLGETFSVETVFARNSLIKCHGWWWHPHMIDWWKTAELNGMLKNMLESDDVVVVEDGNKFIYFKYASSLFSEKGKEMCFITELNDAKEIYREGELLWKKEEWIGYQDIEWVDGNRYVCKIDKEKFREVYVKQNELLRVDFGYSIVSEYTLKTVTDAKYRKIEN